jgi:hypothetical protein
MRAFLACGVLVIAGLAVVATAAMSADLAAKTAARAAPAARAKTPAAQNSRTATTVPFAAPRAGKTVPATLGGPAKYDAKKGAMLGGTVMQPRH